MWIAGSKVKKWTDKFRKIKGKPTNNAPKSNSLEPDESDYNLVGEYASNEINGIAGETYNPNEGDYNLGEAYVTSARSKPINSVVWEKEEFDPSKVQESVTGIFTSRKVKGLGKPGCLAIIVWITFCSTFLALSWSDISLQSQESGLIAVLIIAAIVAISIFSYLSRSIAYKINFCLTAKKNVFVVIEESETNKMVSQLLRYNYFVSTYQDRFSVHRALILVANDSNYNLLSFEGYLENNIVNLKQPITFFDNYCARFEAEKCSPMIDKIISLLESSNLERENHLY